MYQLGVMVHSDLFFCERDRLRLRVVVSLLLLLVVFGQPLVELLAALPFFVLVFVEY